MAACEGKIYVGQIGVRFEIETQGENCPAVDWAGSDTLELVVSTPDKETKVFPATVENDSLLVYVTQTAEDLPLPGKYLLQAHVVGPGYDALGETVMFTVFEAFR